MSTIENKINIDNKFLVVNITIAIHGTSKCGKTTFLRTISGNKNLGNRDFPTVTMIAIHKDSRGFHRMINVVMNFTNKLGQKGTNANIFMADRSDEKSVRAIARISCDADTICLNKTDISDNFYTMNFSEVPMRYTNAKDINTLYEPLEDVMRKAICKTSNETLELLRVDKEGRYDLEWAVMLINQWNEQEDNVSRDEDSFYM